MISSSNISYALRNASLVVIKKQGNRSEGGTSCSTLELKCVFRIPRLTPSDSPGCQQGAGAVVKHAQNRQSVTRNSLHAIECIPHPSATALNWRRFNKQPLGIRRSQKRSHEYGQPLIHRINECQMYPQCVLHCAAMRR